MIVDKIENYKLYQHMPAIYPALEQLYQYFSTGNFPAQKQFLPASHNYITPVTLTTKAMENCIFEAHIQYIDIHFIINGKEQIDVAPVETLHCTQEYDASADYAFYQGEKCYSALLTSGYFMVCFTHDAHKVGIAPNLPDTVEKLVAKIIK